MWIRFLKTLQVSKFKAGGLGLLNCGIERINPFLT